jgi:hypothetical protein
MTTFTTEQRAELAKKLRTIVIPKEMQERKAAGDMASKATTLTLVSWLSKPQAETAITDIQMEEIYEEGLRRFERIAGETFDSVGVQ